MIMHFFFFFNDTATTEIYTVSYTLSLHDALPISTQRASAISATAATLNGTVNPNRLATTYHFEYGTTTSYGSQSPAVDASAGSGSSPVSVSTNVSGLT